MIETISFIQLFKKCMRGIGYTMGTPAQGEFFERVTDAINDGVRRVWRAAKWPQLMLFEKRIYRMPWAADIAWSLGHECFYEGRYYRATEDSPTGFPDSSDGWQEIPEGEMVKFIALDQPWEAHEMALNGIDLAAFAFDGDPRLSAAKPISGCKWMGDLPGGGTARVLLPSSAPSVVTVCFLPKVIRFDVQAYNAGQTYFYGDVVYDEASGECYRCIVQTSSGELDGGAWERVRLPRFMEGAVKAFVKAEFMEDEQGRAVARKRFDDELQQLKEEFIGATGAFDEAAIDLGE